MDRTLLAALVAVGVALLLGAHPASAQPSYLLFEGGPVRPIALSPDGSKLFVANAPENHLEIFDVGPTGLLSLAGSVPVGMEPVAVAARTNGEVWVVNHLSDSVSIVDVSASPPRVVRTLLVGDEPRDIVFAGSPQRAFVTTAHRGQHRTHSSISAVPGAGDPQLTTEGVGRADVWVFDAASPGSAIGGVPVGILGFFADTPRALATDGTTVYVAAFHSGNQTTVIPEPAVPDGFANSCAPNGSGQGVPGPSDNANGNPAPETGVIVKWNGSDWLDALGCAWNGSVELSLPDRDVFAVNADTLAPGTVFRHVGTILFNMAINPTTGKLYVTNTESPNHVRFEGPGNHGGSTVQGHLSETRVSVLDPAGPSMDVQHLNQHIDYGALHTDAEANHAAIDAQVPHSLATPLQVLVDDAGQKVYVAAFGSARVGVFDVAELEDPSFEANFDPTVGSADYLTTGGGPAGLALDAAGDRLFVYTRFDNEVQVFDVAGAPGAPLQTVRLPTAEPRAVIEGRPFLYDAVATSGNGEASCASCHVFGDFDSLAWNLGDPDGAVSINNQPAAAPALAGLNETTFHPMKGPMTTQTLRGLSTHGATHWRGDRLDGFFGTDDCTGSSGSNAPCDEEHSFLNFIAAFEGLIGRETPISGTDMQKFTDFALQLMLPPNPVASLDNTLGGDAALGHDVYFSCGPGTTECGFPDPGATDTVEDCDGCHNLDPASGFFGSGGEQSFEGEPQNFKVAHLRNMYQKVGMFGMAGTGADTGDQVRGFGFLHDGSVDTMKRFLASAVFSLTAAEESQLEQFMLRFPSDLAPVVGQQVSLGPGSPGSTTPGSDALGRATLLASRAGTAFDSFVLGGTVTECDLVVKTVEGGVAKGYLRQSDGSFLPDDGGAAISGATLRARSDPNGDAQDLVYTCAPPGSGTRMGIDRDQDSVLDGQDNCPAWPNGPALGTCIAGDAALMASPCTAAAQCGTAGICSQAQEDADLDGTGDACDPVLLPEPSGGTALALGVLLVAGFGRFGRAR
jgi:DNA-binding beta-propeller fold protein YncE